MAARPHCGECRYWETEGLFESVEDSDGIPEGLGQCRRHAPVVITVEEEDGTETAVTVWPETHDGDWCGDWQSRTVEATGDQAVGASPEAAPAASPVTVAEPTPATPEKPSTDPMQRYRERLGDSAYLRLRKLYSDEQIRRLVDE